MRRARSLSVVGMLLAGALGVISSTQTWIDVTLADGAQQTLAVPGSDAVPVLTPLSLAALALGAALSIVGPVLRYVLGVIALAIAGAVGVATAVLLLTLPVSATAATVTKATGISGTDAVADLVASMALTPWPAVTLLAELILAAAAVFALVTARRWQGSAGRKYRRRRACGRLPSPRRHRLVGRPVAGLRPHGLTETFGRYREVGGVPPPRFDRLVARCSPRSRATRRRFMSNPIGDPGHGHSPAAWTAVIIMLLAITLGTLFFWLDMPVLVWASVGLLLVGAIVGWAMTKAGYGANGAKSNPKAH